MGSLVLLRAAVVCWETVADDALEAFGLETWHRGEHVPERNVKSRASPINVFSFDDLLMDGHLARYCEVFCIHTVYAIDIVAWRA